MKNEFYRAFGGAKNVRRIGLNRRMPILLVDCVDPLLAEIEELKDIVDFIDYGFYSPKKYWWLKFKTREGAEYVYEMMMEVCPCCGKRLEVRCK